MPILEVFELKVGWMLYVGLMDDWTDGLIWMGGWMDGWMDG